MTETVAFITFSRHYVVLYSAAIPAYIDSFLFDEGFSRASFEASSTQLHLSLFLSPVLKASFICWRNLSLVFISGFCSMRAFPNHYWIWGHRKLWLAWAFLRRNSDNEARFPQFFVLKESREVFLVGCLHEDTVSAYFLHVIYFKLLSHKWNDP